MIACRYLVRVDLARRLTRSCLNSKKLAPQLQSCSFHQVVNPKFCIEVGRVLGRDMDRNKRNKVSCEWRQFSTQASSSQRESPQRDLMIAYENLQVVTDENSDEVEGLQGEEITLDGKDVASIAVTSSTVKHSSSIQVCSSLIRFIKGKEGATQKKVEEEMGVQLILPSSRKEDSIIIEGASAESVSRASERILTIIDEAVKSPSLDYSHFISLPLAIHPQLVDKLNKFQNSILVSYPPKKSTTSALELKTFKASELGIDRSIFIKPKTFHLTVLMLKLWNKDLVKAAADVLQSVSPKVFHALDARPLFIRLKGLECMKGSFSKARILYAPVEEIGGEERLLRACQVIIDAFVEAGLVLERDAKHKLKLHATVMNVRHRKRSERRRSNDYFDARSIADQYGCEDWGEYRIREAHLSERFAFDQNGYYHCCASIPFPESLQLG